MVKIIQFIKLWFIILAVVTYIDMLLLSCTTNTSSVGVSGLTYSGNSVGTAAPLPFNVKELQLDTYLDAMKGMITLILQNQSRPSADGGSAKQHRPTNAAEPFSGDFLLLETYWDDHNKQFADFYQSLKELDKDTRLAILNYITQQPPFKLLVDLLDKNPTLMREDADLAKIITYWAVLPY